VNWIDVVIIVALVLGTFMGWRVGLVNSVAAVAGIVLGAIVAGQYHNELAGKLEFLNGENIEGAKIAAFAILFGSVVVAAQLLAMLVTPLLRALFLSPLDAFGGAALGLIAIGLFLGVLASAYGNFEGGRFQEDIKESRSARFLADNTVTVLNLLPEDFRKLEELHKLPLTETRLPEGPLWFIVT
jgi:membrane protein required for colicin V production